MKKALLTFLSATLAFAFACQPAQDSNKNKNANANIGSNDNQNTAPVSTAMTDKVVQLFIYDDPARPGYYTIEDPGSVTLYMSRNQKIVWCVVYTGTTPPSDVVIDGFRTPPPPAAPIATNPFGNGTAADNTFQIPSADFDCKNRTKTPRANAPLGAYKYKITVKVNGIDRGSLDPQVIING